MLGSIRDVCQRHGEDVNKDSVPIADFSFDVDIVLIILSIGNSEDEK